MTSLFRSRNERQLNFLVQHFSNFSFLQVEIREDNINVNVYVKDKLCLKTLPVYSNRKVLIVTFFMLSDMSTHVSMFLFGVKTLQQDYTTRMFFLSKIFFDCLFNHLSSYSICIMKWPLKLITATQQEAAEKQTLRTAFVPYFPYEQLAAYINKTQIFKTRNYNISKPAKEVSQQKNKMSVFSAGTVCTVF